MKGCEKLAILDVDGTVFPYNPYYEALIELRKRYPCVRDVFEPEALWHELRFGAGLKETFFGHFRQILRDPECPSVGRLFKEFTEISESRLRDIKLRRGAKSFLGALRDNNWCTVFVTNSGAHLVEGQLRRFNLVHNGNLIWPGYATAHFGLRGLDALKPSGKLFDAIVRKYSADRIVVIGDSMLTEGIFGHYYSERRSDLNFVLTPPGLTGKFGLSYKRRLRSEVRIAKLVFGEKMAQEMHDTAVVLYREGTIRYPSSFRKISREIF